MWIITIFYMLIVNYSFIILTKTYSIHDIKNDFYLFTKNETDETIIRSQVKLMKNYMDTTIDPCNDFYEYACGNWKFIHPIPDDKPDFGTVSLLSKNINKSLNDIFSDYNVSTEDYSIILIQNFYKSCMNTEIINKNGAQPVLKILKSYGGMPALDSNWNEKNFDLVNITASLLKIGVKVLLQTKIDTDPYESDKNILYIEEAPLVLKNRHDYLDDINSKTMIIYHEFITNVLLILGVNSNIAKNTATDIINLEKEIAKEIAGIDSKKSVLQTTISNFNVIFEYFDWQKYITIAYNQNVNETLEISLIQKIDYKKLPYFHHIGNIIKSTKPKIIANYISWRILMDFIDYLDPRFDNVVRIFNQKLTGQISTIERWEKCIVESKTKLGMAVGKIFIENFFDKSRQNDVINITQLLCKTLQELIINSNWIDTITKEKIIEKAKIIALDVGYPENILSEKYIKELYINLTIDSNNYFQNIMNIAQMENQKNLSKLNEKVNKKNWHTYPQMVNAHFNLISNRILIPAGILQPPFYHHYFPPSIKFGGLGSLISHEILHGFDINGRLFDANGNLGNWWSNNSIATYINHTNCFIKQYNNYTFYGKQILGNISQNENIADNVGLLQAYKTYVKVTNYYDYENFKNILENLNLTDKQIFFLSFGQVFCSNIRNEAANLKLNTDIHCPEKYRVIGTLSNSKEFSEAFNCPLGSPMNPIKKCLLW